MSNFLVLDKMDNVVQVFEKIANTLLNKVYICTPKNKYIIGELEFYLHNNKHSDPFVHCDENQSNPSNWYFHKLFGKGFKEGTYKGVDITFGTLAKQNKSYGGILLRSIQNVNTGKVTEGSCSVVNKFLEDNGNIKSVKNFVKLFNGNMSVVYSGTTTNLPLYLLEAKNINKVIYTGPRVGLTLKKNDGNRMKYIMKYYRYFTIPTLKKFKCGIICALHQQGMSNEDICKLTKTNKKYVEKYICEYVKGNIDDIDKSKNLKVNDLCNLIGYCYKNKSSSSNHY